MKRESNNIVLSYMTKDGIVIRITSAFFLGFVIFGILYSLYWLAKGKYSDSLSCVDVIGIFGLPILLIMAICFFIDYWRIVIANEKKITISLLGIKTLTKTWQDIKEVKMEKMSPLKNFFQPEILCLYTNDDRKIIVPVEWNRFDQFYNLLKTKISNVPVWSKKTT